MTTKENVDGHYSRNNQNDKNCCDEDCFRRGPKNSDFKQPRPPQKCLKVSDLVYKFLEKVATANDERRQRNNARTNFQRLHVRKYNRQNRRPDDPKSTDEIHMHSQYQIPRKSYFESDSHGRLPTGKKRTWKSSDTIEKFEEKSSSKFVKDYVEAVNKSKRRAERYICKALSFGMDAGFLVPTAESDAHVLRVSSSLDLRIIGQNMDWGEESEAEIRRNPEEIQFRERGNQRNSKIRKIASSVPKKRPAKSKSKKFKSEQNRLDSREKRRTSSPGTAKKMRRKSKRRKAGDTSREIRSEATHSDDSNEPEISS